MWSALAVAFVWNRTNGAMKLSESREVEVKVEGVVVVVVDDDDVGSLLRLFGRFLFGLRRRRRDCAERGLEFTAQAVVYHVLGDELVCELLRGHR